LECMKRFMMLGASPASWTRVHKMSLSSLGQSTVC